MLRDDAHCPETVNELMSLIKEWSQKWAKSIEPRLIETCIFPECGSGYHEWHVLAMLRSLGFCFKKVVFMDALLDLEWSSVIGLDADTWLKAWGQLADSHAVSLASYKDYSSLGTDANSGKFGKSLVLYINGHLLCSSASQPAEPSQAKRDAERFWHWCSTNAINEPLNFRSYWLAPYDWSPWKTLHNHFER